MTKHEVLAIHYSTYKPPIVGESPLIEGKSLPGTPTADHKPVEEEVEFKKPNVKKRLSVREMVGLHPLSYNCKVSLLLCVYRAERV